MVMEVWRLHVFEHPCNAFRPNREESWDLKLDKVCENSDEARKYIIEMSLAHTILPTLLVDVLSEPTKDKVINDFCFENPIYLTQRRYFLGKPCRKTIIDALEARGVKVVEANRK